MDGAFDDIHDHRRGEHQIMDAQYVPITLERMGQPLDGGQFSGARLQHIGLEIVMPVHFEVEAL
ncbi:hypothetical protein D3C80_2005370 [compost metagenome]